MKYKDGSNVKKRAQLSALAKQWFLASVNPVSGEIVATKWDRGYLHIKRVQRQKADLPGNGRYPHARPDHGRLQNG